MQTSDLDQEQQMDQDHTPSHPPTPLESSPDAAADWTIDARMAEADDRQRQTAQLIARAITTLVLGPDEMTERPTTTTDRHPGQSRPASAPGDRQE
jgi:hypothetical protein